MEKIAPDVLTIGQLSRYLQITESTLYKLAQAGRLPGKKVGRQWRFRRDAIDQWLAETPHESPAKRRSLPRGVEGQRRGAKR